MKFLVGSKAVNYKKADKNCRRAGYQLAKVTNKDENKKLEEIIGQHDPFKESQFWIGLNDRDKEGNFRWTSGGRAWFTNWAKKQPDDALFLQDCVTVTPAERRWDDDYCNLYKRYVCYKLVEIEKVTVKFEPLP